MVIVKEGCLHSLRDEEDYPPQLVTHHISLARSLASSLVPIWKLSADDCFLLDVLLLLLLGLLPLVGVISLTLPCSESSDFVEDTQDKFAIGKLPEWVSLDLSVFVSFLVILDLVFLSTVFTGLLDAETSPLPFPGSFLSASLILHGSVWLALELFSPDEWNLDSSFKAWLPETEQRYLTQTHYSVHTQFIHDNTKASSNLTATCADINKWIHFKIIHSVHFN